MNIEKKRDLINMIYQDLHDHKAEIQELGQGYDKKGFYIKTTVSDSGHEYKFTWRDKPELASISLDGTLYKVQEEVNDLMYNFFEDLIPENWMQV